MAFSKWLAVRERKPSLKLIPQELCFSELVFSKKSCISSKLPTICSVLHLFLLSRRKSSVWGITFGSGLDAAQPSLEQCVPSKSGQTHIVQLCLKASGSGLHQEQNWAWDSEFSKHENNASFFSHLQAPPRFSKSLNYLQMFKRTSVSCLHCHAFQMQAELYNQGPPKRQELCCIIKIGTGSTLHYHTRQLCIPHGNILLPPKFSTSLSDFLNFME